MSRNYLFTGVHLIAVYRGGMTSHIFGVGLGLFVILTLWISAALIFLISLRIEKRIGAVALTVAAIITVILISVPRAPQHPVAQENKVSKTKADKVFLIKLAKCKYSVL